MLDIDAYSADSNDSFFPKPSKSDEDKADLSFSTSLSIINKLSELKQNVSGMTGHKPAELFRKDLISAMKLADSEALRRDDYVMISDHWRQDWEKGVQVPVNPNVLKHSQVRAIKENENLHGPYAFKLPKKLLHAVQDETYRQGLHELHETQQMADEVCRYDLDELDCTWLANFNELCKDHGDEVLTEYDMERIMEQLETRCYDSLQEAMKTTEGIGIEYDEDVVCDICRSPEGEDDNEMIFCDVCDICVHQACYGVLKIPPGSWLCRPCALGIKPSCVLCPNLGGAMKSTADGMRWAHLNCALWIPEIVISDTEKMEPIAHISDIPSNRWSLICSLCRERTGACIQCSIPKCKTAFHVTCAFQHNLDMKANFDVETELVLKGYCAKHSKKLDRDGTPRKATTSTPKKHTEMTEEEKKEAKARKLEKLAAVFNTYVGDLQSVASAVQLDINAVDVVYNYWLLKRKCNFNKQLMTPKVEEGDLLLKQNEDGMIARLKMFIHLRQDLERVRNLCYMVTKREKMRNRFLESKRDIFLHQAAILRSQSGRKLNARDYQAVVSAHRQSTSVYDNPEAVVRTARHLEAMVADTDGCEADGPESFSINKAASDVKRPKAVGRPRIKGHHPGRPNSALTAGAVAQRKRLPSTENPYAKPTYRSFEWMLPARRRSSVGTDDASAVKRKRRRNLMSSLDEVSVKVDEDQMDYSSADFVVDKMFLDVTGSDVTQVQEPSLNSSPSPSTVNDQKSNDVKGRQSFAVTASPHRESVNGTGGDSDLSPAGNHVCEPCSSTPLKRSPLHPFEEAETSNHMSAVSQSSPRFNMSRLQARHFSDILVDRTSPSDTSRNRTTSQNDEDTYVDVVSDTAIPSSTASHSVNGERSVHNGFADGLARLSKVKTKKQLAAGGLVNGLRQQTLDSFVHRVPNGNRCQNGIDDTAENNVRTEAENQDLEHNSISSVKLKQTVVDWVKETGETSNTNTSDERTTDGVDNFVDIDSIEGIWRRRTSLRSSTAFMNLLGPDLGQLT